MTHLSSGEAVSHSWQYIILLRAYSTTLSEVLLLLVRYGIGAPQFGHEAVLYPWFIHAVVFFFPIRWHICCNTPLGQHTHYWPSPELLHSLLYFSHPLFLPFHWLQFLFFAVNYSQMRKSIKKPRIFNIRGLRVELRGSGTLFIYVIYTVLWPF